MDIIFITDLRVDTIIGIYDWERTQRQTVSIDIEMSADIRSAAAAENVDATLNYKAVSKRVEQFVADSRFQLIETLAERLAELWMTVGRDDPEVFSREMLRLTTVSTIEYCYKLFFGTEIRTRHTENFESSFERLLNSARACDEDNMIVDALLSSSHGGVYRRIQNLRENVPQGFKLGVYDFDPDTREGTPQTF